eukprot:IDg2099t1
MKPFVVHNNPTLRQSSTKLIISTAAINCFRLGLLDVTQAYLQAKDKFTRDIYIRPKPRDVKYFSLKAGELLHLQKPLYGICDAGDYWGATFRSRQARLRDDPLGWRSLFVHEARSSECIFCPRNLRI